MLSLTINGKEIEYIAPTSYTIEHWYDRHTRDYVVQVFDNFDCETECLREPDKKCMDLAISWLKEKYNATTVTKK